MKIQLIRNATMKLTYGGQTILTDPMLSPKSAFDPFAGIARNPTVELPMGVNEILEGIDCVMVSHNHPDHLDPIAIEQLPKKLPMFCQPGDEETLKEARFQQVVPIDTAHTWNNITITRTGGKHGKGKILERTGKVSGFVFQAEGEPTVYWVGDSIWCEEVKNAITTFNPDIIISHSGGATIPGHGPIVMDGEQTVIMAKTAPKATIIAIHMESLDHCPVTRETLREMADQAGIPSSRFIIPNDGQLLPF